jgi:hypothetical protein
MASWMSLPSQCEVIAIHSSEATCASCCSIASMGECHGAHPIRIGLVVGFQRGAKARLVSMKWSGFQGAGTPFSAFGAWSMGFRGERSLPDHGGVGGSLEAPLTGDATAKRCTASRITHHDLTPNKVVTDAQFVRQKWLGSWSEAAARGMQRESAKRLPCQDVRNAKRSFVVTRTSCGQRKQTVCPHSLRLILGFADKIEPQVPPTSGRSMFS